MSDVKCKTYLFKYYHDGSWWNFELPATDADDAKARVQKLPHAQLEGELMMKLPAVGGWFARAYCVVRNFFRNR